MFKHKCIFLFGIVLLIVFTHGVPLNNDLEDELDVNNEELADARSIPDANANLDSDFVDQLEVRDVSSDENTVARRRISSSKNTVAGRRTSSSEPWCKDCISKILRKLCFFGKKCRRRTPTTPPTRPPPECSDEGCDGLTYFVNPPSILLRLQQEMLQAHNTYRARHCAPSLTLDENLNKRAQKYAGYLAYIDKMVACNNCSFGQNLYVQNNSARLDGKGATDLWYNEVKKYNFKQGVFTMQTGNFIQLVWKDSKELGVSNAFSKSGKTYIVALYSPAGNIDGQFRKNVLPAEC